VQHLAGSPAASWLRTLITLLPPNFHVLIMADAADLPFTEMISAA
jgi:hypothetical protein